MKTIKIETCLACLTKTSFNHLRQVSCPLLKLEIKEKVKQMESGTVHIDCKLEDYKKCDCEPFQSCEKCAEVKPPDLP